MCRPRDRRPRRCPARGAACRAARPGGACLRKRGWKVSEQTPFFHTSSCLAGGADCRRAGSGQAGRQGCCHAIAANRVASQARPKRPRIKQASMLAHTKVNRLLAGRSRPAPARAKGYLRGQLPRHDAAGDQGEVCGGVEEADDGPHGGDEQGHGVPAGEEGRRGGEMVFPARCVQAPRSSQSGARRQQPYSPASLCPHSARPPLLLALDLAAKPVRGRVAARAVNPGRLPTAACTLAHGCGTSRPGGP